MDNRRKQVEPTLYIENNEIPRCVIVCGSIISRTLNLSIILFRLLIADVLQMLARLKFLLKYINMLKVYWGF